MGAVGAHWVAPRAAPQVRVVLEPRNDHVLPRVELVEPRGEDTQGDTDTCGDTEEIRREIKRRGRKEAGKQMDGGGRSVRSLLSGEVHRGAARHGVVHPTPPTPTPYPLPISAPGRPVPLRREEHALPHSAAPVSEDGRAARPSEDEGVVAPLRAVPVRVRAGDEGQSAEEPRVGRGEAGGAEPGRAGGRAGWRGGQAE